MKKQRHTYITERIQEGFSVHRYGQPTVIFYGQGSIRQFHGAETDHRHALDHHIRETLGPVIVHVHDHKLSGADKRCWYVEVVSYE